MAKFCFVNWREQKKMDINTTKKLNNGTQIPYLGLGVFQVKEGKETADAVRWAIEAGYRHIDTAALYGNEKSVGQGVRDSGIDRSKLFITTKLWKDDIMQGSEIKAFEKSLKLLRMDYVDLYLIHWPVAGKSGAAWKVLEEIYKSGRAKAIGVSNFMEKHLDSLLRDAKVVPAVDQVECHPHLSQSPLVKYCEKMNIAFETWSPLGGTGGALLDDPVLLKIAAKYGKSTAQVVLRWNLQSGMITIPKSIHQARIKANTELYNFELSTAEMKAINDLDKQPQRSGPDPNLMDF
jgi:diketogulonate reductase-like aldo/keto reductase